MAPKKSLRPVARKTPEERKLAEEREAVNPGLLHLLRRVQTFIRLLRVRSWKFFVLRGIFFRSMNRGPWAYV